MARLALIPRVLLTALVLGLLGPDALGAAEDSVVRIQATVAGKTRFGSGFVVRVDGTAAYVVTAAHVVEGDPAPRVFFRGQPYSPVPASSVRLEGGDPDGFAVLRLDSGIPSGTQPLAMAGGGGSDLGARTPVEAVGIPADIGNWAVLPGRVIGWKNRKILFAGDVDEGNSGGPLLAGGVVVGMVMRATRFGEAVPAFSLRIFLRNNGVPWGGTPGDGPVATETPGRAGTPVVQEPVQLTMAEPPPGGYFVLPTIGRQPDTPFRLVKTSERRNAITDTADWWVGNGLEPLTYEVPNPFRQRVGNLPATVPTRLKGLIVTKVIRGDPLLAIYGGDFSEGRYLLGIDSSTGKQRFAFDFAHYEWPQDFERANKEFVQMAITWAHVEGNILYVANSHSTYARSSRGYNAYVTAIRIPDNRILWRSQPLVSNAHDFVVIGDAIICGYGFTDEPDFLYVLNKADGRVAQRVPVKTAPSDLVLHSDQLYVRTYNTDYTFELVHAEEGN